MRVTFLGTAAAEGIPSLFCNCYTCKQTRKIGNKNIRRRSSIMINDDLLIDMGPDLLNSCVTFNINLSNLKFCLITHCHFDHFYPENIEIRSERYQLNTFPNLNILANSSVFFKLTQLGYKDSELHINRIEAELYKSYIFDDYTIIPIPANHAHEYGMSLNYIVKYKNKTLLYATDTGIYDDVWIKKITNYKFNCIILDGTNVFTDTSPNHLNIKGIEIMKEKFYDNGNIYDDTEIICTHFSHEGLPLHDDLAKRLSEYNIITAYDGMVIEL